MRADFEHKRPTRPAAVSVPSAHVVVLAILLPIVVSAWVDGRDADQQPSAPPVPEAVAAAPQPPPPAYALRDTIKAPVRPNDNLSLIFQRHGLHHRDLQLLLDSGPLGRRLTDIYPGHQFEFDQDADGKLLRLMYRPNHLEALEFQRVGDRFEGTTEVREPEVVLAHRHGVIETSLFAASHRAGLDDGFTTRLAELFQWDIDFILDIRKGDEFRVLFNERRLGGKHYDYGDILAAEFVNDAKTYRVVRYEDPNGAVGYYTEDGRNIRKAFLRAPVDFTRISSLYNPKRVHPLWKTSMPHRGIDYAAPTGTTVKAASDGKVVVASRTAANGNYVVIQHGERYQTKYLHLSRFARGLKKGTRVRQGQKIGEVGATGWATGPHLHYEFLVDGVHQNPRTVDLPAATPITDGMRAGFEEKAAKLLAQLDGWEERRQIAPQEEQPSRPVYAARATR